MTGEETLPEFTSNRPPQVRIGASSICLDFSSALTARSALYLCRNAQGNWRPLESSPAGRPSNTVLLFGGGTVNAVLEGVLEAGLPLGILRLGTTNDLARTLGIPRDPAVRQAHRLGRRCSGSTRSTNRGKKSLPSIFTCAKRRKSPVLFERK
jgi:Diacylglycerol kinase catalytic domain